MTDLGTLKTLLRASPHPAWLIDSEGRILLATRAATELYGAAGHVSDRNPGFKLDDHQQLFARVQADGGATFTALLERRGRISEVRVEARPSGHPSGFIAWFIPQPTTDALIETERLASMGTLAAGIGHEVKQPLTYLLGNLGVASSDVRQLTEQASTIEDDELTERLEEIRAALSDARHGAQRIRDVVQDLLSFSRSEEGSLETIQLRTVLETAITMATPQFRHHATLVRAFDEVPPVLGNHTHLSQLFTNLLLNAAHATRDVEDARIRISCKARPGFVDVEVRDNGSGIPPADRERIFEPFVTTKAVGEGTGLGLAICRRIVGRLGGELRVVPDPDWTVLRATIPVLDRHAFAEVQPTPLPEAVDIRMTLLVVDDEHLVLATMRRALSRMADVVTAPSVNGALEALATQPIDAILCDVMMPGMNGVDLFETLKERYPHLTRRTIFMTGGSPHEPAQRELVEAGCTLLEKPFDIGVLRTMLDDLTEA